jgi:tetratricopeptide (TPR) repeat protein
MTLPTSRSFIAAGLAASVLLSGCGRADAGDAPRVVTDTVRDTALLSASAVAIAGFGIARAELVPWRETWRVPARLSLDPRATETLGAISEGRVTRVVVMPGDRVRRGQVLVAIHSHEMMDARQAERTSAAAVTRAESDLALASDARARAERLYAAKALSLAEQHVSTNPDSPQAQYDLGAAVGVLASYGATVDGKMMTSFRQAHRAFDAHERVLSLDPSRKDAGLIVGTYRYIVSTLSLPMRWMAYLVGFGGDREMGIRMVEEAAKYPSENQTDAKVALLLLYNREARYPEAQALCRNLMAQFPRNRLFVLEAGATALRASQFSEGERLLTEGLTRFADDKRPRAFGELGLWYYKRGMARVAQHKVADARADLDRARSEPALDWVKSRIALETG